MGIAYLIMLIVYIALAKGIYTIIVRPTTKVWIKRSLIAFFILLPTYDIIIGNALKFYYCQFTELEKINKTIERPEGVLLKQEWLEYNKNNNKGILSTAESYINSLKLEYVQIKRKNDYIRTYVSKGGYIDHNGRHRLKIEEIDDSPLKPRYMIIESSLKFPRFVNEFLVGREIKIIDSKDNKLIFFSKRLNHQKYNFITVDTGYFLRGKSCGGETYVPYALKKIITKDNK